MALASEFLTSVHQRRQVLLGAAASMGLAGRQESTSARLPPQVLQASEVSMPAEGWELPTSARPLRQVLPAAAFMALEGAGLSKAAGRRSDRAASDIAERPGEVERRESGQSRSYCPRNTSNATRIPFGSS